MIVGSISLRIKPQINHTESGDVLLHNQLQGSLNIAVMQGGIPVATSFVKHLEKLPPLTAYHLDKSFMSLVDISVNGFCCFFFLFFENKVLFLFLNNPQINTRSGVGPTSSS